MVDFNGWQQTNTESNRGTPLLCGTVRSTLLGWIGEAAKEKAERGYVAVLFWRSTCQGPGGSGCLIQGLSATIRSGPARALAYAVGHGHRGSEVDVDVGPPGPVCGAEKFVEALVLGIVKIGRWGLQIRCRNVNWGWET
jgi:hypothetical protein